MAERYTSSLDLRRAATLGLNCLERCVDPRRGRLPFFVTQFKNDPAELRHDWPDFGDLTSRYLEAFILGRRILGLAEPTETERAMRDLFLSYFNEGDGLSYRPKMREPYFSSILNRPYNEHVAEIFDQSRVLHALVTWYEETKDPQVLARTRDLIEALDRRTIRQGTWSCFEVPTIVPGYTVPPNAKPMPHQLYFTGSLIHPLVRAHAATGMELALSLAQRFTDFARFRSGAWNADGSFVCPHGKGFESAVMDGHVHSRLATVAGMIELARATADRDLLEFSRAGYEWFDRHCCTDFGWTPEFLGRYGVENEGCETCATMDQIHCVLALAEAGFPQYWDAAERIIRNQLLEQQLIDTHLIANHFEQPDTDLSCFHDVAEKVLGAFAGWAAPNDFIGNCDLHFCLMNCCAPSGVKAVYLAWENILRREDNRYTVNILMDRCDDLGAVRNHQPRRGQVDITLRRNGTLSVRLPRWLAPADLKITRDDRPMPFRVEISYAVIPDAPAGATICLHHALPDEWRSTHANGRDYKVRWVGDTVVAISPPGRYMPLYDRDHLLR